VPRASSAVYTYGTAGYHSLLYCYYYCYYYCSKKIKEFPASCCCCRCCSCRCCVVVGEAYLEKWDDVSLLGFSSSSSPSPSNRNCSLWFLFVVVSVVLLLEWVDSVDRILLVVVVVVVEVGVVGREVVCKVLPKLGNCRRTGMLDCLVVGS
jgi:hypothetical protein